MSKPAVLLLICLAVLALPVQGAPTVSAPRDCVILLHGMGRSGHAMSDMATALADAGYRTVNLDYPSRDHTVETLAMRAIGQGLQACRNARSGRIHFVTHSLGGILVRYYLRQKPIPSLGRVVMLSPPNRGSEAADYLKDLSLYQWLFGPAGQQLGTGPDSLPQRLGPVSYPVGVLTGDQAAFFDLWLAAVIPGKDDGKVAVQRAKVAGMTDFLVLHYSHPFIMDAPEAIDQTRHFLRHGCFRHPAASTAGVCSPAAN